LDIADNPQTYLRAQPVLSKDGQLVAVVTNPTDLFINDINVAFSAEVNELSVNRTLTLTRLAPGTQRSVSSGWQFSAEDLLTNVRVRVISAVASEPHAS
jgi:hypothetical protein